MKAIISHTPENKYMGLPDVIDTVDITSCIVAIQRLSSMADIVNENPNAYGEVASNMSYLIRMIKTALEPQLSMLDMRLKENGE